MKHGNAEFCDIVGLRSSADAIEQVLRGDLDRSLDSLQHSQIG